LLRSKQNGLYVGAGGSDDPLSAKTTRDLLTYSHVFDFTPLPGGGYGLRNEVNLNWVSATKRTDGPLLPARISPSDWETYTFQFYGGNGPSEAGTEGTIMSHSNNMYVNVQANGELWPNAANNTIASARFYFVDANAGVTDTRTLKF